MQPSATTRLPLTERREKVATGLAPIIAGIRKAGHHANGEIAKCLNEKGLRAPSGGPFSRETVRRIQRDIKQLGLGESSRTVSAALSARAERKREEQAQALAELVVRRKWKHPERD